MACTFYIKGTDKKGLSPVFLRVRSRLMGIDIKQSTMIRVDPRRWKRTGSFCYGAGGRQVCSKLEEIELEINYRLRKREKLSGQQIREIIDRVVFEKQLSREPTLPKTSLNDFIKVYLEDIKSGRRPSNRGKSFAASTVITVRQAMTQFLRFQEADGQELGFDDIDMSVYNRYTSYLKERNYSINSIGKCINQLKTIMSAARAEGLHTNTRYMDKRFKGPSTAVDSIYLTLAELDRMMAVPETMLSRKQILARDVFMIGVWTAQRVSDYNNIKPSSIRTAPDGTLYIDIRQKKTGAKVSIPCNSRLREILGRYGNSPLPHISDKDLNRAIKEIGFLAGITENVEKECTKGGKSTCVSIPKFKLIHSHTARCTGATLMYLAGIDIYDIMKVTGHSSPAVLKRYIRANTLDIAAKLSGRYRYFD